MTVGRRSLARLAVLVTLVLASSLASLVTKGAAASVFGGPDAVEGFWMEARAEGVPLRQGPSQSPAQATAPIPGDWQRVEPYPDTFDIALPPGWVFNELEDSDSQIGEFLGDGIRLSFDYGLYTDTLVEPGDAGYLLSDELIHCKAARVIEPLEDPARITGVYFAEVDKEGEPPFELVVGLEVHGVDLNASQIERVLRIVRTVRFERQCSATPTAAPATQTPAGPGPPSATPDAPATSSTPSQGAPIFLPLLSPDVSAG